MSEIARQQAEIMIKNCIIIRIKERLERRKKNPEE
jgi:hypothetical protein